MTPAVSLLDAIDDPHLFAPWFKERDTWAAWLAFLATLFGLPMTAEQLAVYQQCTKRLDAPVTPTREAWLVIGRRGGKSFILSVIAVFLACFIDYRKHLAPGERATILVIAADRRQSRVIMRYVKGLIEGVPMLARMVARDNEESLELDNRVIIEVATASFRTVRGYTIAAALCDETAFWRSDDSANPDTEVLDAIRPGMATIPTSMLLCASSSYAKRGALYEAFQRHYGKERDPILVWRAPTQVMNPTVPKEVIDEAFARDPASAAAEFGAEFRSDVEDFLTRDAVMACVLGGVRERPVDRGLRYVGFVDPSGAVNDAFTIAIAHREGAKGMETMVLDLVREVRPPFSPEAVVSEFSETLKRYRIAKVFGDRYGGEWPREQFRKAGIHYEPSEQSRSELYLELLPMIMSRQADLLDHDRMVTQLTTLERHTGRTRDSIDHRPGGNDDIANAVAGALVHARQARGFNVSAYEEHNPPKVILGYPGAKKRILRPSHPNYRITQ